MPDALASQQERQSAVVFVDGELPDFLKRYRSLLKSAGVDANWQQLRVVYVDAAGAKAVIAIKPLTIGPMFAGAPPLSELNGHLKRALRRGADELG